jgi:ketosteroid isomerase-like protein
MTSTVDIVSEPYVAEQERVAATLHAIMEAVQRKDFARLAAFHLDSPKFTKFDDVEPLDRQDIATANQSEAEGLGGVEGFQYELRDLKIDVFGPTAVATFIFDYRFEAGGEALALTARTTMVFVDEGGTWKIAHEHLSPFGSDR